MTKLGRFKRNITLCIFCGEPASRKGEHLFSKWLGPILDAPADKHVEHNTTSQPVGYPKRERFRKERFRPGAVHSITIAQVCESCNNGWMNRVEERARPVIKKLLANEVEAISVEEQNVLAAWCALKAIVGDHRIPAYAAIGLETRKAFMESDGCTVPSGFSIWVARVDPNPWETDYLHDHISIFRASEKERLKDKLRPNSQMATMTFGNLFIHCRSTELPGYRPAMRESHAAHMKQLHPGTGGPVDWSGPALDPSVGHVVRLTQELPLLDIESGKVEPFRADGILDDERLDAEWKARRRGDR